MKLSTKLAVLFVIISTLAVAGMGLVAYQNTRRSLEEAVFDDLTKTTILKQAELTRWLRNNEVNLESLAKQPLVRQYASVLVRISPESSTYDQAYIRLEQDYLPLLLGTGNLLTVSILHPDTGRVLISTNQALEGMFRESETYFIEGKAGTFTQTPEYSLSEQHVMMHISTPIQDANGQLIAVLVGHLDLEEMSRIMIQGRELSNSEESYLINRYGFLVTRNRFDTSSPLLLTLESQGIRHCLQGNSGTDSYSDYRGTAVLGAYSWLPDRQLCLITEIDQAEAFATFSVLGWQTFWLSLITVLIVSTASIFFSRSITSPLHELVIGTQKMSQGQLDHRVNIHRKDELGHLGAAFNQMATSMEQAQQHLTISEKKYRTLIEGADAAISTVNFDGTFLFMNRNAAAQLGGLPEDFVGKSMYDLFPTEVAERQLQEIRHVIKTGSSAVIESPSIVSGKTRWFNTRLQPIQNSTSEEMSALVIAYDVTARKEAELALSMERDFVQTILRTTEALIVVLDTNGRIVKFNHGCEQLTGYNQEEVIGRQFWDFLLLADERESVQQVFSQLRAGDFPNNHENYWVTKSGSRRAITWTNTCQVDHTGKVKFIIGTGIDITARKETEEELHQLNQTLELRVHERTSALQESEKRFRRAIIDAPFPIMMHAEDGEILLLSDSWTEITGYSLEDIPTIQVWTQKAYGQKMEVTREIIDQLYGSPVKTREGEFTITTSSGHEVVWDFSSSPLGRLLDGRRFVISMAVDVTIRKRAMRELRESEARFRTAFDHAAIGRAMVTMDGKFMRVNAALSKMTGYSDRELINQPWSLLMPLDYESEFSLDITALLRGEVSSYQQEVVIQHKEGRWLWILLNVVVVRDEQNNLLYFVADVEDVTQRKKAEDELQVAIEELKRSNAELQQFAYVASHDLQEPLRMVTSYLQLLQRRYSGHLDDDADEFIGYAVDGATRMKQLIQDLLTFSRVGTKGLAFTAVNMEAVLHRTLTNLGSLVAESGAIISHDPLPVVWGDATQLEQVMQNLISNAIKFQSEHKPVIHVRAELENGFWHFTVRDNGIGFEPQFSERIFIIFQRLHSRMKFSGTGIGLAICKKIIERHRGQIWAESTPGKGTTMHFTIPEEVEMD